MDNPTQEQMREQSDISLPCPSIDGGFGDMDGKLHHRVSFLVFNCSVCGQEYHLRGTRVMDMDD